MKKKLYSALKSSQKDLSLLNLKMTEDEKDKLLDKMSAIESKVRHQAILRNQKKFVWLRKDIDTETLIHNKDIIV